MTSLSQKSFAQAIKERRTIYALNKQPTIDDKKIVEIVKDTVLHVPSSFNSQSSRLVVLLNAEHDKFWDFVLEILKPMVPEDQFASTEQRISGFKGGYGTVLFFEDPEPVQALQKAFALYAHHFPTWSEHTSAMHQFALWVALEAEGLGANLQHYNPIIDRKAQEHWNIPMDWKLTAQLVFGGVVAPAGEKEFKPVEGERMFVHGAKV
ncbi:nitroreductase family protein [Massariosphaeria phaeospora]|uniref:Nitroreductase family protein n=1 Tax=Massariosphaeria phaeospora TaxID=100035 RepID=A0A7C8M7V2_9PLEO|nr:nitroreductase family protein [Massariosphaeria phaeospora]